MVGEVCDNLLTNAPFKFSVLARPQSSRLRMIREAGNSEGKQSTAIAGGSERNVLVTIQNRVSPEILIV
jgi:hypothetical protein